MGYIIMVKINTDEAFEALDALVKEQGGGSWSMKNGAIDDWKGGTQPSDEEIQAKMDELKIKYDSEEWKRKRMKEYPTIREAVHAILDDDLENLQILRQAVKEKYPK